MAPGGPEAVSAPQPCGCRLHGACLECRLEVSRTSWRLLFPWLKVVRSPTGKFLHCKCATCEVAGHPKLFRTAKAVQVSHLRSHANTHKHRRAAGDPAVALALTAPPTTAFKQLLQDLRDSKANGNPGLPGVAKRWKVRKMKFCLAEAVRMRTRLQLRKATSMTVHQDASKGRLVMRAQMCGEDLQPTRALLGAVNYVDTFDSSAMGLAAATLHALRELCTPLLHAPHGSKVGCSVDHDLMLHVCSIVEVFNADAASDEQLAAKLLQRGAVEPAAPALEHIFRNLKLMTKDKPHAARRRFPCARYATIRGSVASMVAVVVVGSSTSVVVRLLDKRSSFAYHAGSRAGHGNATPSWVSWRRTWSWRRTQWPSSSNTQRCYARATPDMCEACSSTRCGMPGCAH